MNDLTKFEITEYSATQTALATLAHIVEEEQRRAEQTALDDKQRAEEQAAADKKREEARLRNEILDGVGMLRTFVERFGQREEFRNIAENIDVYLKGLA